MPTRRAWIFIFLAVALYLLANQTQVGWVYVMSNALTGLLLVAFFYTRGMLKSIQLRRTFQNLSTQPHLRQDSLLENLDFFEDDPIEVTLHFSRSSIKPAFLVGGQEYCPLAPPGEQNQPFFIASLFKNRPAQLIYQTTCHRRGLHHFSPTPLFSKGPFGFFGSRRTLPASGEVLVYPQYYPLKRIRLLENKGFAGKHVVRPGAGSEVIGAREYRSGDSLRRVHWRSTARLGSLVVKEFSDDDQLTLAVVLDLSREGNVGQGKFSTFETAIRLAASLGYYADQHKIPFQLFGRGHSRTPPATALSWWGTLDYLARVTNDGPNSLPHVLRNLPPLPFVVVMVSNPNEATYRELTSLSRRNTRVLALVITPEQDTPPPLPVQRQEGLEIRAVNPRHWQSVFDEL
jgi:uncharacterized protein (DUF58 family)